jgi:hypothetical protein
MSYSGINYSIRRLCENKNYDETSRAMQNGSNRKSAKDLKLIFLKNFKNKFENGNKSTLSFTYKASTKSLLNKRLSSMKVDTLKPSSNRSKSKKIKLVRIRSKEEIPDSFLSKLLLDELCIDRINAKKFYENSNQWTFVKSDRKIFCTHKGNFFTYKYE